MNRGVKELRRCFGRIGSSLSNLNRHALCKGLLLDALQKEGVSFMGLEGEVLLVLEKILEVDHCLIEEHASDTPGQLRSKGGLDDWED